MTAQKTVQIGDIQVANDKPFVLFAGKEEIAKTMVLWRESWGPDTLAEKGYHDNQEASEQKDWECSEKYVDITKGKCAEC